MTLEQTAEGRKEAIHADIWGKEHSRQKNGKEARRPEQSEGRAVGYKTGEAVKAQRMCDLVGQEKNSGFYSKCNEKPSEGSE